MLHSSLKVVGTNGQISLGKHYAGKQVLVEEQESGVWLIRTVKVIPDNEAWVHELRIAEPLQAAMNWALSNPAQETDLNTLEQKLHVQH